LQAGWRQRGWRGLAVAAAAAMLCWPALWNGYPLLYPDSEWYLGDGRVLMMALRGGGLSWYASERSELYTLVVSFLHHETAIWPVVVVQAVLTAWVIWLTVRGLCRRRPVAVYLGLVAALSVLTGVGWYVSYIMPDILAAVLDLCVYLLVFGWDGLERWERVAVGLAGGWAVTAHGSHLLVVSAECGLLVLLWVFRTKLMRGRGRPLAWCVGMVALAAAAQIAVHGRIYRRPLLFGVHPPFLMARLLADGPAKVYLRQHCGTLGWEICKDVDRLPASDGEFLWGGTGIWQTASPEQRQRLRAEEMPLAMAVLRAYPREQAEVSARNVWAQLTTIGPNDFWTMPLEPPKVELFLTRGLTERFRRTVQSRDGMPQLQFAAVQRRAIQLSVLTVVVLLPWAWRSGGQRLLGLAVVVVSTVVCNAAVTGALSGVFARYQARVVWLVALLAGLMVCVWWQRGEAAEG